MNNRKDFLRWLEKGKQLSKSECKSKMWGLDSLQRSEHLFDICSVDELNGIDTKEDLSLYREYLLYAFPISQAESNEDDSDNSQSTVIAEISGEIPDDITETTINQNGIFEETDDTDYNNIDLSEEVKAVLDSDYNQKKEVKQRLKKESFSLLSEIYDGAYASSGLDNNKDICQASVSKRPPVLVFDVVSAQCYDLANQEHAKMKSYVKYDTGDNAKIFQRTDKAFYYSYNLPEQESSAVAFLKNKPSLDVIQRALTDTIASYQSISTEYRIVCLVPDNLGDFKDNIKSQIKSVGSIIQIPRSIAAAYSFVAQNNIKSDSTFVCYDYGSSELCKTQIRILYDEENKCYEFTRMWRQRYPQKQRQYFDKIALTYLEKYSSKNRIHLSDAVKKALINTRDIIPVLSGRSSVAIATEIGYVSIDYDKEIAEQLIEEMQLDMSMDMSGDDYSCILFDVDTQEKMCYSFENLCLGFSEINNRIKHKKTIWNEYLPELSLEVIHNGRFDKLQLIKKGMIQTITETSMDEEIIIPIEDGLFVFEPGRDKIFCPLIREEFGNLQRDKMAMFFDEKLFPLKEALQVELSLTYHYGDPDSYKLHATALNADGYQVESQWCDEKDKIMDNNMYPEYVPQSITAKSVNIETIISQFYENIDKDWYYKQNGVRGGAPFDKLGNWYVVTPLIYSIVSIQNMFAPYNVSNVSSAILSKMEGVIEQLLGLLEDAENDELNFGNCDFDGKHIQYVKDSILNVISMLGGLCCNSNKEIYFKMVNAVIETKSYYHSRYLLQLSTYILRENDTFGVWDAIDEYVPKENTMVAVRTIGAVCWRNPEWIYSFGECDNSFIQSIIDKAISHSKSEIDKIGYDYNPRSVRDDLETLLGMIRLKETNPFVLELLNCNSNNIKEFVVFLKELNDVMTEKANILKFPFISRLDMEVPEELNQVSSVVYPLIELLTGGNAIKLTGFTED